MKRLVKKLIQLGVLGSLSLMIDACGDEEIRSGKDVSSLAGKGFPPLADDQLIDFKAIPAGQYGLESMAGVVEDKSQSGSVRISVPLDSADSKRPSCDTVKKRTNVSISDGLTFPFSLPLRLQITGSKMTPKETRKISISFAHPPGSEESCNLQVNWASAQDAEVLALPSPFNIFVSKDSKRDGPIYHGRSKAAKFESLATVKKLNDGSILIYHTSESEQAKILSIFLYTLKQGEQPVTTPENF